MINREFFFKAIRDKKLFTTLSQQQVDSMNTILQKWDDSGYTDLRWLAYMLATAYHETGATLLPIEEWGKGKGRPYGRKLKHSYVPYTTPDKIYYGRGYVQLTWYENYELMSRLLYNDKRLLVEPELVMDLKVATEVMFEGMTKGNSSFGDFTGKSLEMYFTPTKEDPVNARRIINGTDKADKIAGHYYDFKYCLQAV